MFIEDKDWEHVKIDKWSVLGAAAAGLVGTGLASKTEKLIEIGPKLIASPKFRQIANWMVNQVKDMGIDGLASAIDQFISTGEIKPENIVVDATAGRMAAAGAKYIPASKKSTQRVNETEQTARTERRNRSSNPDRSRTHLNSANRERKNATTARDANRRSRQAAVTVSASGATGDTFQAIKNKKEK